MKTKRTLWPAALLLLCTIPSHLSTCLAQGTAFAYQGRLHDGANPANGSYDLRFALYDAAVSGVQQGATLTNTATAVSNGLFTVMLDFGNQFPGANRWLELAVRTNGGGGFTFLLGRQRISAAPYSIAAGNLTGALPTAQLTGVLPSAQLSGSYGNALTLNNAANSFTGSGAGLAALNASQLSSGTVPDTRLAANVARTNQVWLLGGNSGTTPGSQFLGTTDNQALEFKVNNQRALRIAATAGSPNLVGGYLGNNVSPGVLGATIGGGGNLGNTNSITGNYGTVGGGLGNNANGDYGTASGGHRNNANGDYATVAGGIGNTASGDASTAMGFSTEASGPHSTAMGYDTTASGVSSTAMGAFSMATTNDATAMGYWTTASGVRSTAMGSRARALHEGSFVWSDSHFDLFDSTADNQFLLRASGGVGINTNNPAAALDINGSIRVGSGGTVIQRIQSGQAEMQGGSASARTSLTINFPTAFASPPKILVSAANDPGWDVDDTFAVSVRRATTTHCVINIMRVDQAGGWSQSLRVNWQAWE